MSEFRPGLAHRLWRWLPANARRQAFTWISAQAAPKPSRTVIDPLPGLAVAGELSRASGLGEVARYMLAGVRHVGGEAWPVDVGPPVDRASVQIAFDSGPMAPPGVALLLHVNPPVLPLAMLRLGARAIKGRKVIGYWAWELPVAPPGWRLGTRFVHEVWVPSRFTAEAIEPLMPGRVRVVRPPLAIAPPAITAEPPPGGASDAGIVLGGSSSDAAPIREAVRAALGWPSGTVVVLTTFNLASSFVRKNPLGAVAAFRQAFADRPDRLLMLKVTNANHFPADFAALQAAVEKARNIRIETRLMQAGELAAMTQAADIILSLHRSEGLGLVLAEAMLLGRPVVCTGWSGNLDFMDEHSAALVPCRLITPQDPRGVLQADGAVWADPDVEAAAAHLRRLADNPAERDRLGQAGHRMATACFGPETLLDAMRSIGAA